MHVICFVNLPWSATARLRKVSLQLPHLSVFSLIKRVFRDALNSAPHTPVRCIILQYERKIILKSDFFKGISNGIPICLGYLSVSFGFGITAAAAGSYGITDEIFAVCSAQKQPITPAHMYGIILISMLGWVTGTFLGASAGQLLPYSVTSALGIVLYGISSRL